MSKKINGGELIHTMPTQYGVKVMFINPFDEYSFVRFYNGDGNVIKGMYLIPNEVVDISELKEYLTEDYSIKIENVIDGKEKVINVKK